MAEHKVEASHPPAGSRSAEHHALTVDRVLREEAFHGFDGIRSNLKAGARGIHAIESHGLRVGAEIGIASKCVATKFPPIEGIICIRIILIIVNSVSFLVISNLASKTEFHVSGVGIEMTFPLI